jgi:hypothetical protein
MSNVCQSCGMPMNRDPKKGGTNADGSLNAEYCSYCYENGVFTSPEIDTPQKMQAFCIQKLKSMGVPKFVGWMLTRKLPKLKRWEKK